MQASRRATVGRSLPNSIFQKFQGIYNQEEQQLKQNQKTRKQLLAKIMQREQQEANLKNQLSKQLNKQENQEIDLFWKNQEERLRAREHKRKMDIDEARRINNSNFDHLLSKSMNIDPYHLQKNFRDDLAAFQEHERLKKQNMKHFYYQSMVAAQARELKKRYDRQLEQQLEKKKIEEDKELNARRQEQNANWRNRYLHQHHQQLTKMVGNLNYQKEIDRTLLEEAIAVKGGHELNQRAVAIKVAEIEEQEAKRLDHLRQLKQQTDQNTYKEAIDKYLSVNYERKRMEQMHKILDQREQKERQHKKEALNQHLNILKGQMRPRVLMQQPDKIQAAGIGSPAHIGKIVHQDRIKQLKWIERSFLQQLRPV